MPVRWAGHILVHRVPQPLHLAEQNLGLARGQDDVIGLERFQDCNPKVGFGACAFAQVVDIGVELEVQGIGVEIFEVDENSGEVMTFR